MTKLSGQGLILSVIVLLLLSFFVSTASAGRYYNPQTMHWTQPDPNVPDPYNPQSLNRYSYALNNPIKYTDPTGHEPVKSEYGPISSVSNKMSEIRKQLGPKATDADLYRAMAKYYNAVVDLGNGKRDMLYRVEGVARYVYTEKGKGPLDMKHVFGSAADAADQGALMTTIRGYGLEVAQLFGGGTNSNLPLVQGSGGQEDSGFTIEDIPSNDVGVSWESQAKGSSAEDAEKAFNSLMSDLGASEDPTKDPKYEKYKETEVHSFEDRSFKLPWVFPWEAPDWWV